RRDRARSPRRDRRAAALSRRHLLPRRAGAARAERRPDSHHGPAMTYRKRGRTIRYENGTIVRVEEAGEAVEVGGEFRAYPHPPFGHPLPLAPEKGAAAEL